MSFEENLINLVKEHEFLYNTKSRSYKNTTKRASTWDTISKHLNRPVQDCKQRWRSLRDRFSREHKDMMSFTSGSAAVIDPDGKWEFYDCLQFLIPSLITRRQIGNTETEESCEREVYNSPPPILPQNDVGGANECNNDIAPKKSRAVKRKGAEETFKSFMDGLNTTVAAHLNENIPDVDMEFMQNMARKMKPLPESVRIQLHARILTIINEELLLLLNNSYN